MIKVGYPSRPRILAGIVPSRPSTAEPGASDKRTSGGGGNDSVSSVCYYPKSRGIRGTQAPCPLFLL